MLTREGLHYDRELIVGKAGTTVCVYSIGGAALRPFNHFLRQGGGVRLVANGHSEGGNRLGGARSAGKNPHTKD
ncbi:hypothetical protein D3C72_1966650 [compost metagenome]